MRTRVSTAVVDAGVERPDTSAHSTAAPRCIRVELDTRRSRHPGRARHCPTGPTHRSRRTVFCVLFKTPDGRTDISPEWPRCVWNKRAVVCRARLTLFRGAAPTGSVPGRLTRAGEDSDRGAVRRPFVVMNSIGPVAFALVGSAKAIREGFDLFGITVVGLAMAFAGGTTRDLLVGRVPLAPQSPLEISLGLLGVGLAIAVTVVLTSPDTHSHSSRTLSDSLRSPPPVLSSRPRRTSRPSVWSVSRRSIRSEVAQSRISLSTAPRFL